MKNKAQTVSKKTLQNMQTKEAGNKRIDTLYKNISGYIHEARRSAQRTVDVEQVKAYWLIGRDIVEEEQSGKERAEYGTFLLEEISLRLTKDFGKGFGVDTLERARKFYLTYSDKTTKSAAPQRILPNFSPNLGWIHYRALMREDRQIARDFYQVESEKNCWSGRELERQMGSLLFERLAKNRDKKGLGLIFFMFEPLYISLVKLAI